MSSTIILLVLAFVIIAATSEDKFQPPQKGANNYVCVEDTHAGTFKLIVCKHKKTGCEYITKTYDHVSFTYVEGSCKK